MYKDIVLSGLAKHSKTHSPFDTVDVIFDYHLIVILPEFFMTTREYELGLEFSDNLIEIIEQMRWTKSDMEYRDRLQLALLMKLDMMDHLNDIKGYLILFDELKTSNDLRHICPYPMRRSDASTWETYIAYEQGDEAYLRFVYKIDWRQRVMMRKWKRFLAGKPMTNQLRHQRDHLTDDEVIRRVDEFFTRYQYTFLSGVMT